MDYEPQKTVEHPNRGTSSRFSVTKFFNENLEDDAVKKEDTAEVTRSEQNSENDMSPEFEDFFEQIATDHVSEKVDQDQFPEDTDEERALESDPENTDDHFIDETYYDETSDLNQNQDIEQTVEENIENDEAASAAFDRFKSQNEALSYEYKEEKKKVKRESIYLPILKKMWFPLGLSLIVFLISAYFILPVSKIGKFTVSGNVSETSAQIATASGLKTGDTIYSIYKQQATINKKIESQFSRVANAKLIFHFPNRIEVMVTEHKNSVALQQGKVTYLVLDNGYVVKSAAATADQIKNLPLLVDFTDEEAKTFVKAFETLTPSMQNLIKKVTKTPTSATKDFIALQLSDGNQVRVALSQMAVKLPYYPSIAKQIKAPQVVDMEAGIYAKSLSDYQADLSKQASAKSASISKAEAATNSSASSNSTSSSSTSSTVTSSSN
ncbi:hypothetical protein RT41_GL000342 [Lactococcus fujiensis JCM 16395]|uniref:Cell division protein DivIB n=1 Tax=Lactococcus fujiensis JCM 16395 TaxID=1291764 RepID=A0A2A5RQ76_9LACT|nr:hypothetical protein RT41_GL000342 [Lactococcus fujiensis JCM 16395]